MTDSLGSADQPAPTLEQRELAYYKRQVDALAGDSLKLEYTISGLRHELKQKRQGFALLSQLQESIGAHKNVSSIFSIALPAIGATLGMDRAVVLTPAATENVFRPTQWIGYRQEAVAAFETLELEVPAAVADGTERLIVNKATASRPIVTQLQQLFDLPYFICVPVLVDGRSIALLLSGRLRESKPLYPPLDEGDLDTFNAIAGLIGASIRNMRLGVLEEMDRLKTQFFANLSHEFRTPITLTLGPLEQLLKGRYGLVPSQAEEQLRVMRRNQERLLTLVNQILDLAKLEANEMRLRTVATPDVNRFVGEIVGQFDSAAADRGLSLHTSFAPELDGAELYVDREKLERVVINLLSNALKFTKRGFITVMTEVHEGALRLSVSDTGIGIQDDQLLNVFDRFRQADGSESREYAGTGLGLALVQEIARLHAGSVSVSSRYGEGTTFRVTLPLGRGHLDTSSIVTGEEASSTSYRFGASVVGVVEEGAADRSGADEINAATEASFDGTLPTILYAEDNPDLRSHVRDLLVGKYNVFLAVDGRDALEKIQRYRPELVLSDQMMPRMSGRDLLRAMREDSALRTIPVIFLTARAGTEARIESLEAGAEDYLSKPFNEGELLARVRNLLRAKAQERALEELNHRLEARLEEQVAELVRGGELQRYVPRAVAERVLSGDPGFSTSERRKITVLRAATAGFAELTDQLEPEDLAAVTNEYLREVTAVVMARGGTMAALTTDDMTVLFGAPVETALPDQAMAAAHAALEMRTRLRELAAAWRRRGIAARVDLRIGLDTGYCTVGVFGSDVLRSYTAVGTPVALAGLFADDATGGTIVCGAATQALLDGRVGLIPRGPRALRGAARPVESFEIREPGASAASLPRLRDFAFMPR